MGTPQFADARAAARDLTTLGWSEDRIAQVLGISPRTVRRYRAEGYEARKRVVADAETLTAEMARSD